MLGKLNDDNAQYWRFTGPQRVCRAVSDLQGILQGIGADNRVCDAELARLTAWLHAHEEFADQHPFSDVLNLLRQVLADGIVDDEELADLFWMCGQFSEENRFYCRATADMQRLQGILAGVAADKKISVEELRAVQAWMEQHEHLKGSWPFDEIESFLVHVLKDGVISDQEHKQLISFFSQFALDYGHRAISISDDELAEYSVSGVCAVDPVIEFEDRTFTFTGTSTRCPRKELVSIIEDRGGIFLPRVTQQTNYLIVGANGNACWAFSCYGRKVEQAMALRRQGLKLLIIHELDFWDSLG